MFSFLKFRNNNSPQLLESFYQHTDLKNAQWVSLAINKNTISGSLLTKELDIRTSSNAFSLKMAETPGGFTHQLWQNNSSLGEIIVASDSPFLSNFNSLIDRLLDSQIDRFQKEINKFLQSEKFETSQIEQDEKALEWIKVSFNLLEKAVIKSLTDKDFLFQAMIFIGLNPKTEYQEIRLILFNLDIKYTILPNGFLRIRIFNDKDGPIGSAKKASLEGDFNFRKREMTDELTKLISALSSGIKI